MKHNNKYLAKNKKKRSGKKLCIFLMVVFSLVMIADIANLFITPAQSQISFSPGGFERGENSGFSMRPDMEMPEGGERPSGDFQMSEDGEMPSGDFQRPEGENQEMPGGRGEDGGQISQEGGERPSSEGRPGGGQGGFLQTVRKAWLPILIVCALGDTVCLVVILRLRRKEKAIEEAFGGVSGMPVLDEEDEDDSDEPPKRKKGPWTGIVCMVVAFAMILAMFPTEDGQTSSADVHSEVISGTAEAAQINTVLSGAGTLEADTLTPVTVPQQVTVLKYHVRNGETVSAGDPLVSVDKTSASAAMMELDEILEDLDADLETERQSSPSSYIYSTAAGRVKKIYAYEGTKVTDALYEHGALMLLSLDGLMKVSFESDENLTVGDTVTVKYSGGTEEGRIATVRQGKVTVTISDETAWYGAEVTVLDESGQRLGTGKLEINSELKVIGYYGTVKSLSVSLNSKVSVGSTLATLEDTGYTTDYQILLARRKELENQMQKLSQLARTGMVYAENDGIVSGVPDNAEIELLSGSTAAKANNLSDSSNGWQLILLSNVIVNEEKQNVSDGENDSGDGDTQNDEDTSSNGTDEGACNEDTPDHAEILVDGIGTDDNTQMDEDVDSNGAGGGSDGGDGDDTGNGSDGGTNEDAGSGSSDGSGDAADNDSDGETGNGSNDEEAVAEQEILYCAAYITAVNATSVTINYAAADGIAESSDPRTYIGQMTDNGTFNLSYPNLKAGDYLIIQITLTDGVLSSDAVVRNHIPTTVDTTPVDLNGNYAAYLIQASGSKLYIGLYPTVLNDTDVDLAALQEQMTQVDGFAYTVAADTDIPLTDNGITSNVKLGDLKANDLLVATFDRGIITAIVQVQRPAAQQIDPTQGGQLPSAGTTGTMPSGSTSAMSGMPSGSGMVQQETYEQYIVAETELLYVSDQEEIALTITVDELDILSLEEGLSAQVTLDAMKGQSFTGQIARIGHEGTNDGGNTKFSVTVTLQREAAMLDGMNAAVKFITATSNAAVSIPVAALVEDDGKTYVYTTYDEKTDTLAGLAEVETGASDGDLVEILSGLRVGDNFYYRYADTVTYSFLTRV